MKNLIKTFAIAFITVISISFKSQSQSDEQLLKIYSKVISQSSMRNNFPLETQKMLQNATGIVIRTEIFDNKSHKLTISKLIFSGWEYIGRSDCKVTKDLQGWNKRPEKMRFVRLISDTFGSYSSDSLYFDFVKAEKTKHSPKLYSIPVSLKKANETINYILEVRNVTRRHSKKRNGRISFFTPFYVYCSEVENFSFKLIEII
jgi:hypothetical protein